MEAAASKVDDGWEVLILEKGLQCPVCIEFFCDPLTLSCGHTFCRLCLLQSTRLAPDGRSCPSCRSPINIQDPARHDSNAELESKLQTVVPQAELETRAKADAKQLQEFLAERASQLPVFSMQGVASRPGQAVRLHFFEPRYKVLIRNCWEGNRRFLCTQRQPAEGSQGLVVQVESAEFMSDGRANIQGTGVEVVTLKRVWVEEGTAGLFYAEIDSIASNARPERHLRTIQRPLARVNLEMRASRIRNLLEQAIQEGAPEYNSGNVRRCTLIYVAAAQAALRVLERDMIGEEQNQEVAARLRQCCREADSRLHHGDANGAAWALRHCFDAVLEDPRLRRSASPGTEQDLELPVFYSAGFGAHSEGQFFRIRFFEPRYRTLAREVERSDRKIFLCAAVAPEQGSEASMVRLNHCSWDSQGNANVECEVVASATSLSAVRQDGAQGGLFYAHCRVPATIIDVEEDAGQKPCCCALQ
eukprot:TRINITY_DN88161_c0_g1_i1.p1 TRINITY_DN88161_c0_g1~~TRINITY_DN88161_c0_g1_i1.p1  ORF type:complete len:474 (+),score=90.09 TRINITY_DN88161_c0_g1_i1:58-1479(+)